MTSLPSWSNGHRSGSTSSAEPGALGPLHVSLRRDRGLAEGMAIAAAIEARLFGLRLLSLRAAIDVVPAEADATGREPASLRRTAPRRLPRKRGRPAGSDLAAAARAIDSGAKQLRSARERTP